MPYLEGGGKKAGKTDYSGRRRPMTRKSGFSVSEGTTGGEVRILNVPRYAVSHSFPLLVTFSIPPHSADSFIAFGGWFLADKPVEVTIEGGPALYTLTKYPPGHWNKVGSLWRERANAHERIQLSFASRSSAHIALWEMKCGVVSHRHLENARAVLLKNMHLFSPEAHFFADEGKVKISSVSRATEAKAAQLVLKSCNRCARFLPINTSNERNHLSFSNHCVASHRRPCSHALFGRPKEVQSGKQLQLEYGFQLECRFCKKFEVNAAHNPQRTAAQMKEDAARRRGFELLVEALYQETPQLRYRHTTGRELLDDVYRRFGGNCFNCGIGLQAREAHLDHTRPLALLWPLDGSATLLCKSCNSVKRDRPPVEFYTPDKLATLASITGIPIAELKSPQPNMAVVDALLSRLDWFFGTFLKTPDMREVRDGKVTAELVVKALQKAIVRCMGAPIVDLVGEYRRRTARRQRRVKTRY